MTTRRALLTCSCGVLLSQFLPQAQAASSFKNIPLSEHERAMQLAITEGKKNPMYPFGAVITHAKTGEMMATGVNNTRNNPGFHGEIDCMNNYVARHGNQGWNELIIYTSGEPCPMCMSAIIWSGMGGVVYASSIQTLVRAGMNQIMISAQTVAQASPFYKGEILGGILEAQADEVFMNRPK